MSGCRFFRPVKGATKEKPNLIIIRVLTLKFSSGLPRALFGKQHLSLVMTQESSLYLYMERLQVSTLHDSGGNPADGDTPQLAYERPVF